MGEVSFVKILRSGLLDALDLIREHRPAFLLLFYIAMRARRTPTNIVNLGIGEVKIGSNSLAAQLGLTEGEYRTAKKKLEQAGIVTFRATNWGTIAKLVSTNLFDPNFPENDGLSNRQEAERERVDNSQVTTNNNEKEIIKQRKAPRGSNFTDLRPVSQEFSLKMHLEYQKEMEKLMHEKEIIEASLVSSQGVMAKKRLEEQLSGLNDKISKLKLKEM